MTEELKMEDLKLEKLTLENLDEFFPVFKLILSTCFPEYSGDLNRFIINRDYTKKVFFEKLKKLEWLGFIARLKGKIVGFIVTDDLYGGVAYCHWIGIKKELQGKGIGTKLLKRWEQEVKKRGGHKLMLITQSPKSGKFYLKNDFKDTGFEEKAWFGMDCWKYGKLIGEPDPKVFLK